MNRNLQRIVILTILVGVWIAYFREFGLVLSLTVQNGEWKYVVVIVVLAGVVCVWTRL